MHKPVKSDFSDIRSISIKRVLVKTTLGWLLLIVINLSGVDMANAILQGEATALNGTLQGLAAPANPVPSRSLSVKDAAGRMTIVDDEETKVGLIKRLFG